MEKTSNAVRTASWTLAIVLLTLACVQFDVTWVLVHSWWQVAHPPPHAWVVCHWFTPYTIASGLFAPLWCLVVALLLWTSYKQPILGIAALSLCVILLPVSCSSATGFRGGEGYFFGLEEVPFSGAERSVDSAYLACLAERLRRLGHDYEHFPLTEAEIKSIPFGDCIIDSPYWQDGSSIPYTFRVVRNSGRAFGGTPDRPGIVYYSVNTTGKQFVLTISGLNAPVANTPSMGKETAFVGGKQPWGGLLAYQGALYKH